MTGETLGISWYYEFSCFPRNKKWVDENCKVTESAQPEMCVSSFRYIS